MNKGTMSFAFSIGVAIVATAQAGDLNPPSGPITSTMKTLTEVEPRTAVQSLTGSATALWVISQPGSYYLAGNITGESGKNGIEISADNVTLDLNGFALIGVPGSLAGVAVPATRLNVSIRNGAVADWGQYGVDLVNASNSSLDALHASDNAGPGMGVGIGSTVIHCTSRSNSGHGFNIAGGSNVSQSTAAFNGGAGFAMGDHSSAIACVATSNGQGGVESGFGVGLGSTVANCTAANNIGRGFTVNGSTVVDCVATGNGNDGIAGGAAKISGCRVFNNVSHGIEVGSESLIVGCTVTGNGSVGIAVANLCHIRGNRCSFNAIGIRANNGENRIEENNLVANATGILVSSGGNFIVKNSVRASNTAYSIPGDNTVGPIITATGTITTTNPWANFVY